MEQNNIKTEFEKRRAQKNKVVLAIVLGLVALVWAVTMVKMNIGG